jgi:LL-diaminopimelate aminotransferase
MNNTIINSYYDRLPGSYLFSTIAKKIKEYQIHNEKADIIRLGIGDVSSPLIPAVIEAMHKAVNEMSVKETFHGYGPEQGYRFLREAIIRGEYTPRGISMDPDEVLLAMVLNAMWQTFKIFFRHTLKLRFQIPFILYI